MRIFAFHLLNDYSGSPKVFSQLLKAWTVANHEVHLVTCDGKSGFLSGIPSVHYGYFGYRWSANPWIRLVNLMLSQLQLLLKFWTSIRAEDIIYVNTVLPFGAAVLGKLKGCRVIYHVHETSMKPLIFKRFLFGIVRWCATDVIYVSDYLAEAEPIIGPRVHTVHNALPNTFNERAANFSKIGASRNRVLMICSLKAYKGVFEFVALARRNPSKYFRMVLNATEIEINNFFAETEIPSNLALFPVQSDVHPQYQWADVVVNLSRPSEWVETFGLTIIEAMAYKLPVIAPPVGGIAELIQDGVEGYKVDCQWLSVLSQKLNMILDEPQQYLQMQAAAQARASYFSEAAFVEKVVRILELK